MRQRTSITLAFIAALLALVSCGGGEDDARTGAARPDVVETERDSEEANARKGETGAAAAPASGEKENASSGRSKSRRGGGDSDVKPKQSDSLPAERGEHEQARRPGSSQGERVSSGAARRLKDRALTRCLRAASRPPAQTRLERAANCLGLERGAYVRGIRAGCRALAKRATDPARARRSCLRQAGLREAPG